MSARATPPKFAPAMLRTALTAALLGLALAVAVSIAEQPSPDASAWSAALRARPGFLFLEIYTQDGPTWMRFLTTVAGFRLAGEKPGFVDLASSHAEFLLNTTKELPGGPFRGKLTGRDQGLGVEIGLVVADVERAREKALAFKGWQVTPLRAQPWGETDFRVLTPEGYYVRLTQPAR